MSLLTAAQLLANLGADTAETERNFAELLPIRDPVSPLCGRENLHHPVIGRSHPAVEARSHSALPHHGAARRGGVRHSFQRERSVKIKLKIKKTDFEN